MKDHVLLKKFTAYSYDELNYGQLTSFVQGLPLGELKKTDDEVLGFEPPREDRPEKLLYEVGTSLVICRFVQVTHGFNTGMVKKEQKKILDKKIAEERASMEESKSISQAKLKKLKSSAKSDAQKIIRERGDSIPKEKIITIVLSRAMDKKFILLPLDQTSGLFTKVKRNLESAGVTGLSKVTVPEETLLESMTQLICHDGLIDMVDVGACGDGTKFHVSLGSTAGFSEFEPDNPKFAEGVSIKNFEIKSDRDEIIYHINSDLAKKAIALEFVIRDSEATQFYAVLDTSSNFSSVKKVMLEGTGDSEEEGEISNASLRSFEGMMAFVKLMQNFEELAPA